ncbi:Membrane protein involved in the export of O-antigen and teichoic acid [Methylobacterium pseudosasicola]|uniref:Membrane protein involved in the export of O-antigen and teichoic acid n=2 Tax=Methylobacterium pseudosasicola TaxID=582667 RepID=A0A1I4NYD4_9HYPH|nr:Membrane protein involved in the export of O-antigen and teichoic acid [Methylobacterium pseudosasicola]
MPARGSRLAATVRAGLSGRFAVILSGELIQSLFHFALNILLVRELGAHDYGLFAIVFTVGAVGITYIRALVAVPATLHLARSLGRPAALGYDVMFGSGAALVSVLMALVTSVALVPVIGLGALAAGAFVGLYGFRSYLRIVLLARGRPRIAGLSDLVYALCGGMFVWRGLSGEGTALLDRAFLAIALAHAIAIAVAYGALRQRLRIALHPRARARYRAIWRTLAWSLAGVTSLTVQGQGLTLLFALLAGPAAYAPIAATLVLYAPLRIPTSALMNMVLPEISGLLAAGQVQAARKLVVRHVLLIGCACVVYGLVMAATLPLIEQVLFKGRFAGEAMGWIGLGVWAVVTTSLLYAIPRAYLEASAAFRTITAGAVASAALGFALMVPLLLLLPPASALLGLLASEIATLVWSVAAFRVLSRGRRVDDADSSA